MNDQYRDIAEAFQRVEAWGTLLRQAAPDVQVGPVAFLGVCVKEASKEIADALREVAQAIERSGKLDRSA